MKPHAIFLCQSEDRVHYVYTPEQIARIAELTELRPGIFSAESLDSGDFSDVELVFSTWGMPSLTPDQLGRLPKLKAVFYGAGATDGFARPLFARGVRVVSAWQANAIPVAEFCTAQIILALKGYFRNTRNVKCRADWAKAHRMAGPGCYGETVALIGAGAIATLTKKMLEQNNVNVVIIPSRAERRTVSLEEAFSTAFVVSNHLPNRDDNIGVLSGKLFSSMREGAVFINTGRGAQVNEDELAAVLEKRSDLTALLDVTHPEPPEDGSKLYTLPNVQLSTHIAGSINDEVHRMADYVIEELERYLAGEALLYEVNESMLLTSQ
ncbi:MAG: hydroxyacid dehydrogenase [Lentisphaeria bacterium]|nr:hydroxyacid dehydrogenase [Lentisphaeria bacterium]